jgi:hypothetical protein
MTTIRSEKLIRRGVVMILAGLCCVAGAAAQPGNPPPRRMGDGMTPGRPLLDDREVFDFARERMPNLHRLMSDPNRRTRPFIVVARMRCRALKQAEQRNDADALDQLRNNIRDEDQVFGYILELEKAKPEDRPAIRHKIRDTMRSVFEDYLAQRAERIEQLKERLAQEESQLEDERAQMDTRIEQQLDRFGVSVGPATRESADPTGGDTLATPRRGQ